MATPDLIPAPAGDAVTFQVHRSRFWLGMALTFLPVWLLVRCLVIAATTALHGATGSWSLAEEAVQLILFPVAGATGAVLGAGRRLGWVRVSAAGLELAATRRNPVFLPWSAVRSVRLRYAGPLTQLVVTPTSLAAVTVAVVSTSARGPRLRRRAGTPELVVDVGMMTPGPAALLAELHQPAHRPA